jgi:recombination protein RecT
MEAHALKYSKGYAAKKGYTFWEKDYDGMAYKTMIRQLISKWGIMSIDMQTAMENDMAFQDNKGNINYVETDDSFVVDPDSTIQIEQEHNEQPDAQPKGDDFFN